MRRAALLAGGVGVFMALLLLAAFVPAVEFRISVSDPGFPYNTQGYQGCENEYTKGGITNVSLPAFKECVAKYLIPPVNATGRGSLLFNLAGLGVGPFPPLMTVGEDEGPGEFYALLHTSGSKILAAEQVPQMDVTYNPAGIAIQNVSLSQGFLGTANVTISVSNQSGETLSNPFVFLSIPGTDGNYTDKNGLKWMFTLEAPATNWVGAPCVAAGGLPNLSSGATCSVILHPVISAQPGAPFRYSAEVRGYLGSKYSVTKQAFSYSLPSQVVSQLWVKTFLGIVNAERGSSMLSESSTLDTFASLRFKEAVTQPDVSDYGFYGDVSSFFGTDTSKTAIDELLLFPTTQSPYSFANSLQFHAPGHWAALLNSNYTHFGYFVGTGAYVGVAPPCPVSEVPQAGINITQFFMNAGCSVSKIPSTTWLVVILST